MEDEEEEGYVKVGTRFYRVTVRPTGAGDAVARRRRLHYLESCYLCKESIACDRDVFMYKGDSAFCSEDCRDEQMDMDEALHAAARRHRLPQLRSPASSSRAEAEAAAASTGPPSPVMRRRRPTIANLAARIPPVAASLLATGGGQSRTRDSRIMLVPSCVHAVSAMDELSHQLDRRRQLAS